MCLYIGFSAIVRKEMKGGGRRRGFATQPIWYIYGGQAQVAGAFFVVAGIVSIFSFWGGLLGFVFSVSIAWLIHVFSPQD